MAETSGNTIDALLGLVKSQLMDVNTCMPGIILSYSGGKAKVAPIGKKRYADGDILDYPVIPNVRVCWPSFSGGKAGVKGPVLPGDKCLLIFAQQAVDGSDDRRIFDLQDAYAIMCDIGNVGAGDSSNNNDMTMFFGDAYIRITSSGAMVINAPSGISIESPETTIMGAVQQNNGVLSSNGVVLDIHTHGGVETGASNTSGPN